MDLTDVVVVTKVCPWCHDTNEVTAPAYGVRRWQEGELIQFAFPEAPPEWREQLISGMHPACWEQMCVDDDEEEEN